MSAVLRTLSLAHPFPRKLAWFCRTRPWRRCPQPPCGPEGPELLISFTGGQLGRLARPVCVSWSPRADREVTVDTWKQPVPRGQGQALRLPSLPQPQILGPWLRWSSTGEVACAASAGQGEADTARPLQPCLPALGWEAGFWPSRQ